MNSDTTSTTTITDDATKSNKDSISELEKILSLAEELQEKCDRTATRLALTRLAMIFVLVFGTLAVVLWWGSESKVHYLLIAATLFSMLALQIFASPVEQRQSRDLKSALSHCRASS